MVVRKEAPERRLPQPARLGIKGRRSDLAEETGTTERQNYRDNRGNVCIMFA
jgi:hypothetical protein